jgi:hypothetical protein
MNRNHRNQSLLAAIPQTNPFRDTLAQRIFEIGNTFDRDIEAIGQDRRWSAEGKREKRNRDGCRRRAQRHHK